MMQLACTYSELAVFPLTPPDEVTEFWRKCIGCMVKATTMDGRDPSLLTLAAHLRVRRGLFLKQKGDPEGSQECFDEAAKQYINVFNYAPVRQVLKYLVIALTGAPSVNLCFFMGLFENTYSAALMRSEEERTLWDELQVHLSKIDELVEATIDHPLLRAHIFSAMRLICFGMAIAVVDDLPEDQGTLLLRVFDLLVRLERTDDATLAGLYVLKLNEEVADMEHVANAVGPIRDYVVQANLDKLSDETTEGMEDELWQAANDETDAVLADLTYNPVEVLNLLRDIQLELVQQELSGKGAIASRLALNAVELSDLFRTARERYDVSKLLAARTYVALLSSSTAAQVAQTLCQEHDGPRMLAFLCISDDPETSRAAAQALFNLVDSLKGTVTLAWMIGFGRGGETSATGVLEAAVYLLSSESTQTSLQGALVLATLALNDKACVGAMKSLGKQLGPALLDHVLGSTNEDLLRNVAGLIFLVFGVKDEATIEAFALSMIPEISPEDLAMVKETLGARLQGWSKKELGKKASEAKVEAAPKETPIQKEVPKKVEASNKVEAPKKVDAPTEKKAEPEPANKAEEPEPPKKAVEAPKKAAEAPPKKTVAPPPKVVVVQPEEDKPPAVSVVEEAAAVTGATPANPPVAKKLPPVPPKKVLPVPKAKPKTPAAAALDVPAPVAAAAAADAASDNRRGRGYTQQIEAKFAATDVGKTLRIKSEKPAASTATASLPSAAAAPAVVAASAPAGSGTLRAMRSATLSKRKAEVETKAKPVAAAAPVAAPVEADDDEDHAPAELSPEALEELERELESVPEDMNEESLASADWDEINVLLDAGVDERVVRLVKMGAFLDEQVTASLEVDDAFSAEDVLDRAIAKYSAALLLDGRGCIVLRRLASALARKAGLREGEEADHLYQRAAELDGRLVGVATGEALSAARVHLTSVVLDRAKNRAAEEDAAGSASFSATRALLAEAKNVASQCDEPDDWLAQISDVQAYCRAQMESRKKTAPSKQLPGGASKALPKALPALSPEKSNQRMSMGPVATARSPSLAQPAAEKKARPVSTGNVEELRKAEAPAASAPASTAKGKMSNPKAIEREGSVKGKKLDETKMSQKEKLQSALSEKKPIKKVGKLQKEGGGKSLLGRKNWKERLFELSESALEYYEKSNETESPLGSVSLYEVVSVKASTVAGKDHCFEVNTKTRTFLIQANSSAERDEWIKAIQNNCDRQSLMKKMLELK